MRVAIDYRSALARVDTGIGRYARELVRSLAEILGPGDELVPYAVSPRSRRAARDDPFLAAATRPSESGAAERARLTPARLTPARLTPARLTPVRGILPARLLRALARVTPLSAESLTGPVDVFHFPDFAYLPVRRARVVSTIHDVGFDVEPAWYTSPMVRRLRARLRERIRAGDAFLTVSESSRRELLAGADLDPDRVRAIPLGVDARSFRPVPRDEVEQRLAAIGVAPPYVLSVGTIQPRKNLLAGCAAVEKLRARGHDVRWVVAGSPGWRCEATLARLDDLAERGVVKRLEGASDADLAALLSGASAVLVPSHHEGFGLPVLEAMACGAPVVTSAAPALVETGGGVALVVPGLDGAVARPDPDRLADAIATLLDDPGLRERLGREGRARAARFDWRACAESTVALYHSLAGAASQRGGEA